MSKQRQPEWVPPGGGSAYASRVVAGTTDDGAGGTESADTPTVPRGARRRTLSASDYVEGVLGGDRTVFARAITLVESNAPSHIDLAQDVLRQLLPHSGQSVRVGITGVPGVGKSTFIEALGCHLCEQGRRVAVLAVDPSSTLSRGSILGDKTRMERLARDPRAFIRPSPSGGTPGGVARKSRESMVVCEAAGYDVILVETVGVGQSETTVRSMVDFFLLLMLTGAGDELQGIKKGIMELADAVIINKADGDNRTRAEIARQEYSRALHYLMPATEGWQTRAHTCSAITGAGIAEVWRMVQTFCRITQHSGVFARRRSGQARDWMYALLEEHLRLRFVQHAAVQQALPAVEQAVVAGTRPVTEAVQELLRVYDQGGRTHG